MRRPCRIISGLISGRIRGNHGKSHRNWRSLFRARHAKELSEWYRDYLGVDPVPDNYDVRPWHQEAGPIALAPFPDDTTYFGDGGQQWMSNFRVVNLDGVVAQLHAAGISVKVDPEQYPNGRSARLSDPEGNAIELWEPAGDQAKK